VNLIGEHTDYNEGFALPFAITQRTVVAAGRRDDDVITLTSTHQPGTVRARLGDVAPGAVAGWAAYPLGIAWALGQVRTLPSLAGADLFIDSDVPTGGGLSSSAALEMAAAGALTVETALAAGALGARMTGGGFGGSTISLIDETRVPVLTAAITEAFGRAGLAAPKISRVTPGPGARRDAG
jgi:galactokinase